LTCPAVSARQNLTPHGDCRRGLAMPNFWEGVHGNAREYILCKEARFKQKPFPMCSSAHSNKCAHGIWPVPLEISGKKTIPGNGYPLHPGAASCVCAQMAMPPWEAVMGIRHPRYGPQRLPALKMVRQTLGKLGGSLAAKGKLVLGLRAGAVFPLQMYPVDGLTSRGKKGFCCA